MSDTTDPPSPTPSGAATPAHPFLEFSTDYSPAGLLGITETKPRQHDGPARALEAALDALVRGQEGQPNAKPVPLTKVANALQGPPWGFSEAAVGDLKVLLRRYLRHSRPLRTDSTQRRYEPIAVSYRWMFEATPQFSFRLATQEEKEQARAAEGERRLLAGMPFRQRMRLLRTPRWTPPVKPAPITPAMRRLMRAALEEDTK
jgi:hypothetical protein